MKCTRIELGSKFQEGTKVAWVKGKGPRRLPGGGTIRTSNELKDSSLGLQGGEKHFQTGSSVTWLVDHRQHRTAGISSVGWTVRLHRRTG